MSEQNKNKEMPQPQMPRYAGDMGEKKMITSLQNPNEELMVIKQMLDQTDTVTDKTGTVHKVSSYNGEHRAFLKNRYFNLIYQAIPTEIDNGSNEEVIEDTAKKGKAVTKAVEVNG